MWERRERKRKKHKRDCYIMGKRVTIVTVKKSWSVFELSKKRKSKLGDKPLNTSDQKQLFAQD